MYLGIEQTQFNKIDNVLSLCLEFASFYHCEAGHDISSVFFFYKYTDGKKDHYFMIRHTLNMNFYENIAKRHNSNIVSFIH